MDYKEKLEAELVSKIEDLGGIEIGTEEYKLAADSISKLADKINELEKDRNEYEIKKDELINEKDRIQNEKRNELIKNCLTGASICTGIGLTVWGTLKSLKFEETGTVTTIMGRGFINKLLPTKK